MPQGALISAHARVAAGRRSAEPAGKPAGRQPAISRRIAGAGNPHHLRLRSTGRFRPPRRSAAVGGRLAGPLLGAGRREDRRPDRLVGVHRRVSTCRTPCNQRQDVPVDQRQRSPAAKPVSAVAGRNASLSKPEGMGRQLRRDAARARGGGAQQIRQPRRELRTRAGAAALWRRASAEPAARGWATPPQRRWRGST